jgi:hypothetical protein
MLETDAPYKFNIYLIIGGKLVPAPDWSRLAVYKRQKTVGKMLAVDEEEKEKAARARMFP